MGSPDDEGGRFPAEGPRHLVRIDPGFWMFDTPCTQALWEAVMRENPSRFKAPKRPAESVSWDQCQEFLEAPNSRFDGLELSLPSEAQWEYACRAGTEGPRYRESLDEVAWYSENSGGETHPVAEKMANTWGLYDTLGNVREGCADVWTDDYTETARGSSAAPRVIRGGSWNFVAQDVARRPAPTRALGPERDPGFAPCRVQGAGTGRSRTGRGASAGARRRLRSNRRSRPSERSGLDQRRRGGKERRAVRNH